MNQSKKNRHKPCDDIDALAAFLIRPQVDLNRRPVLVCTICAESQIKWIQVSVKYENLNFSYLSRSKIQLWSG